jgi:hypothetical protein
MKSKIIIAFALIFTLATQQTFAQKWKELSDFHAVMSKSFHSAEEKNYQPTKDNATQLVTLAKKWQASEVPSGYKKSETKATLKKLVEACESLEKTVKNSPDDIEAIDRLIVHAHDVFHEIVGKCRDNADDHKGHKH